MEQMEIGDMKLTQQRLILDRLKNGETLTSDEAHNKLGISQFPSRISELRTKGYEIADKWERGINRWGRPAKWKRYSLAN